MPAARLQLVEWATIGHAITAVAVQHPRYCLIMCVEASNIPCNSAGLKITCDYQSGNSFNHFRLKIGVC